MIVLLALATVLVPLLLFIIPGVMLVSGSRPLLGSVAHSILWSASSWTLLLLASALLHIPGSVTALLVTLATVALILYRLPYLRHVHQWWKKLIPLAILLATYAAFTAPFVLYQDGLPTGDSQKAILWGAVEAAANHLPNYASSFALYNRDPVDFYTPGLHGMIALLIQLLPTTYLTATGLFAIVCAIAVAAVAAAVAWRLFPRAKWAGATLTYFFVLSNIRFLRYLREPGYHLQNVVGELFLFGLILLALELLERWRWQTGVLAAMVGMSLVVSHQFSSFLAVFVLAGMVIATFLHRPELLRHFWHAHRRKVVMLLVGIAGLVFAGLFIGLADKLPHLFTRTPHLLGQLPTLPQFLTIMDPVWLLGGLTGLAWLFITPLLHETEQRWQRRIFVVGTALLLLLSFGPRFGIDIPPVRTLFYMAVPLSIGLAYLVTCLWRRLSGIGRFALAIALPVTISLSLTGAYASLSHTVRTNSTLTPGQLYALDVVKSAPQPGGVLVDEYDRTASSWLILAGRPLFGRIASDLLQQMNEALQSKVRSNLYLNQLDYEKIFDMGSLPDVLPLLDKHQLGFIAGVDGSTLLALQHNPLLQPVAQADDMTIFTRRYPLPSSPNPSTPLARWLLRPTTIVNDIGDTEDTFEHLPLSIRATRLSGPQASGATTYRTTTSSLITLEANVGDYVQALWDQDKNGIPDSSLQLQVRFHASPPHNLFLTTTTGATYRLVAASATDYYATLNPYDTPLDTQGRIALTLHNPDEQAVVLDVIALGPALVP